MKLSLQWLFDHIDADWKKIDVPSLVRAFNQTTAEIEGVDKIDFDLENLFLGIVESATEKKVSLKIPELGKSIELPFKDGADTGSVHLIIKKNSDFAWATIADLGSSKLDFVPALSVDQKLFDGSWKKTIAPYDYIIHLDNKSVNHRPDLWGHRGVAREIAAMLKLPFKAIDHLLIGKNNKDYEKTTPAQSGNTIAITVENSSSCKRFSGLPISQIENMPSPLHVAFRLARVDSKPINAIVDATNYVMIDLGQPMHAFDAQALDKIIVRQAVNKEKLVLLDGTTLELTAQDCVVADGKKPLALAGIMGGKDSAVSLQTKSIFLEAACFDATVIRKSSAHHKKRTESSARFEKSLDPVQTTVAIQRFLRLLDDWKIKNSSADTIQSVGKLPIVFPIEISHTFIEQRLGISITPEFIQNTLTVLGFGISKKDDTYTISVPTYRATKDIAIPEDIVEEVGRFYGYSTISDELPSRKMQQFDLSAVERLRALKNLLAYGLQMQEVATYAFFDESFLSVIKWQPENTLKVQDPVSENWQRLVTSLVPNLLKMVHAHAQQRDHLSFFEWARQWPSDANLKEQRVVSGIFFDKKHPISFYDAKQMISRIYESIGISNLEWAKPTSPIAPWYLSYQTALIMHDGATIGTMGKVDPIFFSSVALGDAVIFELNAEFLTDYHKPVNRYITSSKYPGIDRDLSMLIPVCVTAQQVIELIKKTDPLIKQVALVDFFEKPEWKNQKSFTMRLFLQDAQTTLTAAQADATMLKIKEQLASLGAVIR